MITNLDKLTCVRRELALRKRVYPAWIENGRMKLDRAEREIEVMEAIVADYFRLTEADDGKVQNV